MSKRRKVGGGDVPKSRLVVKHRDLNTKEMQAQVSQWLYTVDVHTSVSSSITTGPLVVIHC